LAYADTISVEALVQDPCPICARLRKECLVCFASAANVWFATRWEDVEVVTKSLELFSAEAPTSPSNCHLANRRI
jgi:hypothetical protein